MYIASSTHINPAMEVRPTTDEADEADGVTVLGVASSTLLGVIGLVVSEFGDSATGTTHSPLTHVPPFSTAQYASTHGSSRPGGAATTV